MEKKLNNKPTKPKKVKVQSKYSPVINTIVAAICIIIYLTAIVQAALRFYICVENNKAIAEQEFSLIAEIAYSAGAQGFIDHRFEETMKKALDSSKKIEALIIIGLDRNCAVEKQKDYAVSWSNDTPRFINRFSLSNHEYYRPVPIKGLQGVSIRAVASFFDNDDITNILKETLLIIMAGFFISFFAILFQSLFGKKETAGASKKYFASGSPDIIYAPPADTDDFETETEDVLYPADTSYSSDTADKAHPADKSYPTDTAHPAESSYPQDMLPKGLYSPRTDIGWENYITDRLDSELHRCSSSEQDLTLAIIDFTDLTNDKMFKQSAQEAVSSLTSKDLLFEYGRWGFYAIIPGVSLETSISKSEKYYRHILEKFPRGYNNSSGIFIGLTSRSGRLLNAQRLLLEAGTALKKAKSDPKSPIIAFKSDPEKYREFISKRS